MAFQLNIYDWPIHNHWNLNRNLDWLLDNSVDIYWNFIGFPEFLLIQSYSQRLIISQHPFQLVLQSSNFRCQTNIFCLNRRIINRYLFIYYQWFLNILRHLYSFNNLLRNLFNNLFYYLIGHFSLHLDILRNLNNFLNNSFRAGYIFWNLNFYFYNLLNRNLFNNLNRLFDNSIDVNSGFRFLKLKFFR